MSPNYTNPAARPQVSPQANCAHQRPAHAVISHCFDGVARLQEARGPVLRRSAKV